MPRRSRTWYTGHGNTIKKKAYTRRLTNALGCDVTKQYQLQLIQVNLQSLT